jgi:hypothetical protein
MTDKPKKKATTKAATAAKPAAVKPRKTATKKSTDSVTAGVVAANGHGLLAAKDSTLSYDAVALLAHSYWQQRGHKHGHHEDDWFRAEQELLRKAS